MIRRFICTLVSMIALTITAATSHAQDSELSIPRIAVNSDSSAAYVAQVEAGKIMRLTPEALGKPAVQLEFVADTSATHIVDMQFNVTHNELLIACDRPPRLIRQPLDGGPSSMVALPAAPARIALSKEVEGMRYVGITLPSAQAIWTGQLGADSEMSGKLATLQFSPKELIGLGSRLFITADGTGNWINVINAETNKTTMGFTLNGYHISGLELDLSAGRLLVSHQVLSSNARTDRDDIRWGSLIQNNVSAIPLTALAEPKARLTADVVYRIGDFGRGSADPAGLVDLGDTFAIAVSGTDEVALYTKQQHLARFVKVGRVPDRLYRLGSDRLLCTHRFDSRIAVIKTADEGPQVQLMIGQERPLETAEQRGEVAYFSGQLSQDGWMSCNSCHIEGGSPDLLVDTLGDGTYDSPKKIPTLANVTRTGPWAWHGGQVTLKDQLTKTLKTTMHAPEEMAASSGLSYETLVDDLIAYLSSRDASRSSIPSSTADASKKDEEQLAAIEGGEALFHQHCARCHDPSQHFTSPQAYDVGINDERGHKLFNPPSLEGLRHRTRYLHDGRFERLEQILSHHPQPGPKLADEQQAQLKSYLLSL